MIADTLVVVVMMVIPSSPQPKENRFEALFQEADKEFERTHKVEFEELKKASERAAKEADLKTAKQREEALKGVDFMEIYKKCFK